MNFKLWKAAIFVPIGLLGLILGTTLAGAYNKHTFHSKRKQQFRQVYSSEIKFNSVNAYLREISGATVILDLLNNENRPLRPVKIDIAGEELYPPEDTILYPSALYEPSEIPFTGTFEGQAEVDALSPITLHYRIKDGGRPLRALVYPWPYMDQSFYKEDFSVSKDNARSFEFLQIDEGARTIRFAKGEHTLDENLKIPGKYTVVLPAGAKVNLSNGAMILSYSPLSFVGTEENPIIIESADNDGQGIVVLSAEKPSYLKHVIFKGLSNPRQNGWIQTGALVFYESDVTFENCSFIANKRGDDYLNIFRARFEILKCTFKETVADAFDGDFSDGSVVETEFIDIGNDAVDVSGSKIAIESVTVKNAEDKAFSGGERSHLKLNNVTIIGGELAITSKDLSHIEGNNVTINGSRLGFALFQKKPEFGPASIHFSNTALINLEKHSLIEKGSRFVLNGERFDYTDKNVKDKLYGTEYGKKSVR